MIEECTPPPSKNPLVSYWQQSITSCPILDAPGALRFSISLFISSRFLFTLVLYRALIKHEANDTAPAANMRAVLSRARCRPAGFRSTYRFNQSRISIKSVERDAA